MSPFAIFLSILTHGWCLRHAAWVSIPEQRGASPNVAVDNTEKVFPRNLHAILRSAYELYTSMHLNPSKHAEDGSDLATLFKETFAARDVRVHFLGVWCVSTSSRCIFLGSSILQGHRGISRPYSNQCPSARSHHQRVLFPPCSCTGRSSSQVPAAIRKWRCNVLRHPSRQRGVVSGKSWAHVRFPVVDSRLCTDGRSHLVGAAWASSTLLQPRLFIGCMTKQ